MSSFIGHFLKNESGYIDDVVHVKMEGHEISYNHEVLLMDDIGMAASFFKIFNCTYPKRSKTNLWVNQPTYSLYHNRGVGKS